MTIARQAVVWTWCRKNKVWVKGHCGHAKCDITRTSREKPIGAPTG